MERRILVVDDDSICRTVMARHLRGYGYAVDEADSFASALAQACNPGCALIVLDFWLPEGDGVEHIKLLKREPLWRDKPILIVTSSETDEVLQESFQAGALDLIRKPVSPVELRARVGNLLRFTEARNELGNAQRQLSLAELSAAVAHEVNNPLSAVTHFVQSLKLELSDEVAARRSLERIDQGLVRIRRLVSDLRLVGRQESTGHSRFPLERPLSAALRLMAYKFSGEVRMLSYLESQSEVMGKEAEVAQVFTVLFSLLISIIKEAGGGSLVVATQDAEGGVDVVLTPLDEDGDSLMSHAESCPWFLGMMRELSLFGDVDQERTEGALTIKFRETRAQGERSRNGDARAFFGTGRG